MMAARNDAPRTRQQFTLRSRPLQPDSCGEPVRSVTHPREDDDIMDCDPSCPEPTTNNPMEKQEVTEEELSPGLISRLFSMLTNNSSKETELKLESELKEKTTLIEELRRSQKTQDGHIRNLKINLDRAGRFIQEIRAASGKEVQKLKSIIEEKEKHLEAEKFHTGQIQTKCLKLEADLEAEKFHTSQFQTKCLKLEADLEAEKFHTSQFKAKCRKLEAQIALIEQKAAQESRTSGSYSDDHANPGMLEGACKAADKATDALARFLHNNSVTKVFALRSPELEQFVCQISTAHPAEFSRAIQVKYVWAHWICHQIFQGFEHVFFDADGGRLTSPLNSKEHALECFQCFQQKQSVFSSDLFQAFCSQKYESVFPPWLVNQALIPPGIICNENMRFPGDGELHALFMDVARAVWLLHELAFSFDPPASILRMARGTPYDKQFHEPVIPVEDGHGMSSQMVSLMIRPTFRVRKSIIRSRVFLCNNPSSPTQA